MKLYDIKFGNNTKGAGELFVKGGEYDRTSGALRLRAGETADFGTYFNLLPYPQYREYCGAKKFALALEGEGKYRAEIYARHKDGTKSLISSHVCEGACFAETDCSAAEDGGYLFFTVNAEENCTLTGGAWLADREAENKVKIGIIICTYRRENFVSANIARIAAAIEAAPVWKERVHVFIVDNAQTLKLEEGDFYTVIPNRNLGGSGGFARGMYELEKDASFTHFLLMDDDISFDFATVERTYRLLGALTKEHKNASVGGAMLVLEKPNEQYEFGGKYDGLRFRLINSGLDMRETSSLIKNQNAAKPDYNAWWYCCMPASSVKKYGLPMPFFIKGDDVEYGMRAAEELILMSGIAVWHQDFAGKYTGILEYYIKRNLAIVSSLWCGAGGFKPAVRFAYFMYKNLLLKNYNCVQVLYEAYEDFMKGPSFFLGNDSEEVNERIRRLAQAISSAEEVEALFGGKPDVKVRKPDKKSEFFRCLFLAVENYMPAFMFSKKPGATDMGNPSAADCFMKKTVVHYDRNTGKGLILTLDTKRRRELRRKTYKVFFGMLFGYGKMKKAYRAGWQKMCSRENWERMFFAEKQGE